MGDHIVSNGFYDGKKSTTIPKKLLGPITYAIQVETGTTTENLNTYALEQARDRLGPEYCHISLDDLRRQMNNCRKQGLDLPGHAQPKSRKMSQKYNEALERPEFRIWAERIKNQFGYRCCICNSSAALEMHHRDYDDLGKEELADSWCCIPVCKKCHKVCDSRRQRQKALEAKKGKTLFG